MTEANTDELETLTTQELQQRYAQVHGVTTNSRSRGYLMRQIRAGLRQAQSNAPAAQAETNASEQATPATQSNEAPTEQASVTASATVSAPEPQRRTRTQTVAPGMRDPRLPAAGTVISREFGGRTHHVTIGEEDFEYEGKRWTSLSALAKHIAGTTWNGLLFFKLIPYARRMRKAA